MTWVDRDISSIQRNRISLNGVMEKQNRATPTDRAGSKGPKWKLDKETGCPEQDLTFLGPKEATLLCRLSWMGGPLLR